MRSQASLAGVTVPTAQDHIAVELGTARALFTTRRGGVSGGPYDSLNLGRLTGDDDANVDTNRERLAQSLGVGWERVRWARQVHGTDVSRGEREEADAQIVEEPGVPALVFVADCLPIAIAAPTRAAMVHAGWRPLAGGILTKAVAELGDGPRRAVIGPGIGPCCYEVGDDVRERFPPEAHHGRRLDLKLAARRALEAAGVERIDDVGLCTACHPELFFSHRRDRGVTGRQAGLVWLRG